MQLEDPRERCQCNFASDLTRRTLCLGVDERAPRELVGLYIHDVSSMDRSHRGAAWSSSTDSRYTFESPACLSPPAMSLSPPVVSESPAHQEAPLALYAGVAEPTPAVSEVELDATTTHDGTETVGDGVGVQAAQSLVEGLSGLLSKSGPPFVDYQWLNEQGGTQMLVRFSSAYERPDQSVAEKSRRSDIPRGERRLPPVGRHALCPEPSVDLCCSCLQRCLHHGMRLDPHLHRRCLALPLDSPLSNILYRCDLDGAHRDVCGGQTGCR